ncbi:MAG: alcohol dehydrogenase catalytic domain-containing protein [Phycisphaerae bacterium]|nr:alcohol dehydrogenase catalytic domain-containing protein [Phycisphaerae bacterium]
MKALVYSVAPVRWAFCKAVGLAWKRVYYGAVAPLRLVDRPIPELPGTDWVRLKTILGGICGTDLALVAQRGHPATILQAFSRFPAVLGHENVAVIDQIGSDVTDWRRGQRVCVEPAIGCRGRGIHPPCPECAAGRSTLCQHAGDDRLPPRALIGLNTLTGGSWAQYFVAHQSQLHAVPDAVADDVAILVDPVASAAHAVLRRRPLPGESILVHGSGIIALGIVASIRALGHDNDITLIARHAFQADLAARLGATNVLRPPPRHRRLRRTSMADRYDAVARQVRGKRLAGRFGNQALIGGFDLTFDCTGTGIGLTDAIKWTGSRGTVVAVGTSGITLLDTTSIWFEELSVIGANGRQIETCDGKKLHTYDLIFDWLQSDRLKLSVIPVTRFKLADYGRAFAHLLNRGRHPIVKAAFEP